MNASVTPETPSSAIAVVRQLLERRGHAGIDVDAFVRPSLKANMPDPSLVTGMDDAAETLAEAIAGQKRIMLFGDYDADGMCSIAVMTHFLRMLGHKHIDSLVPDRMKDGYGPSLNMVNRLLEIRPDLIVVMDSGTSASDTLTILAEAGIRVVVVDHHQAGKKLPPWSVTPATAEASRINLVNPAIPGGMRPGTSEEDRLAYAGLCATGLAFILAVACRRALRSNPDWLRSVTMPTEGEFGDLMAYVAVATIADMVPLLRLNRALVLSGMKRLASIPGFFALMSELNLDASKLTSRNCSFVIAPCLNAAGRIAHAKESVDLLTSHSFQEALPLAKRLIELNNQRRALFDGIMQEAMAQVAEREVQLRTEQEEADDCGIVLRGEGWHPGVVGLVAGRLAETTGRVVVVSGLNGTGSGRAPEGFDLGGFVTSQHERGVLLSGGGHKAAAGFRIAPGMQDEFASAFRKATKGVTRPTPLAELHLEGEDLAVLSNSSASHNWIDGITQIIDVMSPFGQANQMIRASISNAVVTHVRVFGATANHLEMTCNVGGNGFPVVVFNAADDENFSSLMACASEGGRRCQAPKGFNLSAATGLLEAPWKAGMIPSIKASAETCVLLCPGDAPRTAALMQVEPVQSEPPAPVPAPRVLQQASLFAALMIVALGLVSAPARADDPAEWRSGSIHVPSSLKPQDTQGSDIHVPQGGDIHVPRGAMVKLDADIASSPMHVPKPLVTKVTKEHSLDFTKTPAPFAHATQEADKKASSAPQEPVMLSGPLPGAEDTSAGMVPPMPATTVSPVPFLTPVPMPASATRHGRADIPFPPHPDCINSGLDTVLSAGCLSRLGPLSMPDSYMPSTSTASLATPAPQPPAAGAAPPSPAVVASASSTVTALPPQGIRCNIVPLGKNSQQEAYPVQVADVVSCMRAALGLHPANAFSVVMLDPSGYSSSVQCDPASGKQVCQMMK